MKIKNNFLTNIKISIKNKEGKVVRDIVKTNKLTFQGADIIADAISRRDHLDLTGLYIRFAKNDADAKPVNTAFSDTNDIRKVTMFDFENSQGTGGGVFIPDGKTNEPTPTSVDYTGNKATLDFTFAQGDLGVEFTAGTSEIYFMGLVQKSTNSPQYVGYAGAASKIFSVIEFTENERFTLTSGQQIDLAYDIDVIA